MLVLTRKSGSLTYIGSHAIKVNVLNQSRIEIRHNGYRIGTYRVGDEVNFQTNGDITIHVIEIRTRNCIIGITAPKNISIMREEAKRKDGYG